MLLPHLFFVLPLLLGQADSATGRLTIRVLDAASGTPIPARLAITSNGKYHLDRLAASAQQWPHLEAHATFIDGEATFELPAGKTSITAAHGMEYQADSRTIKIEARSTSELEFRLKQAINMRAAGWVSGDLHVHMIHGENQRQTSYEDVARTCAAQGLDFVAVGQEYVDAGKLSLEGYHRRCREVSTDSFAMFLGGERPKNILGHQVILGCENPFVISEEPPYFQSAREIHKQGGIAAYVHPLRYFPGRQHAGEWLDFPGNNLARELIFDAFAGPSFDALSVLSDEPANPDVHKLWFNLLNRGLFVPGIADSDACFDRPTFGLKAPGFWNTYFHLGADTQITQKALAEAVRQGRTMATTGPLLQFTIGGSLSGETLPVDGKTREVEIEVDYPQHAFSLDTTDAKSGKAHEIARIELIRNGQVVRQWEPKSKEAKVQVSIAERQPCWYVARAYGTDERWQVAIASPIYFSEAKVPSKREPLTSVVRGRIYDFASGQEQAAQVEVRRGSETLKSFEATGQFQIRMPIDAELVVRGRDAPPLIKNLLLDYAPVHRFLWYLESRDLAKPETLDRMGFLLRSVDLEFPLGHRLAGCYRVQDLAGPASLGKVEVVEGPPAACEGTVAVAAVLTDVEQIASGDTMHVAVVFCDEGAAEQCGPYVIEARGYDPTKPSGFGPLKKFATIETKWDKAEDLGRGYKLLAGKITVPKWVEAGPAGFVDLSVRVRRGHGDAAFVGLAIPLGKKTKHALMLSSSWPTMPLSWPDRNYGIGPLRVCNRIGKQGRPLSDYRQLHLTASVSGETVDLLPSREGRGCADADDAMFAEHFYDQVLNDESKVAVPGTVRPQPQIQWREDLPLVEAVPSTN